MTYKLKNQIILLSALITQSIIFIPNETKAMETGMELCVIDTFSLPRGTGPFAGRTGFPGFGLTYWAQIEHIAAEGGFQYLARRYNYGVDNTINSAAMKLGLRYSFNAYFGITLGGFDYLDLTSTQTMNTANEYGVYIGTHIKVPFGFGGAAFLQPQYRYHANTLIYPGGVIAPHEFVLEAGFSWSKTESGK